MSNTGRKKLSLSLVLQPGTEQPGTPFLKEMLQTGCCLFSIIFSISKHYQDFKGCVHGLTRR